MAEPAIRAEPNRETHSVAVDVGGARLWFDHLGAVYWPDADCLIVSDLHLEKGSSHAERRIFLPPYDTGATLGALETLVARYTPGRLIALGDSFHDRRASARLPEAYRARLKTLTSTTDWIWISGNHDPVPPDDCGGLAADEVAIGPLVFRHEPRPGPCPGEVAGHLHPAVRVRRRGRGVRRRCFASDGTRLIMPAFGALTGGLNVLDRAFGPVFTGRDFNTWAIGRERIYRIDARALNRDPL